MPKHSTLLEQHTSCRQWLAMATGIMVLLLALWSGSDLQTHAPPSLPPAPLPLCDLANCGPLHVSASGRFLAYRDGTPFYYVADTPWHLLQDVSLDEAQQFIDTRLRQGFTALQLNALGMGDDPNAQGDRFGNWTVLNPPYWSHVDAVLKYMEHRGMVAYILPIWAFNWACPGPGKCPSGRSSASLSDHYAFGKTLGARWRSYGNIVWVLGGDISDPPVAKYRQLLAGIRAGGARQLLTAHPRAPGSSSGFMPAELDFFSVQNRAGRSGGGGTNTTGELTRKDALATFPAARSGSGRTIKPVLVAETWYENWTNGGVVDLHYKRGPMLRDAYWGARLSGSLGEGYGDWGSWLASKPGSYNIGGPCKTAGWRRDVQLPGAVDFSLTMKRILMTVPWASLAPDGGNSARIVSGTNASAPLYAAHTLEAGRVGDLVVVVYVRAAQEFSLYAAGTGGQVDVKYFDPSGGDQAHSTAFPVLHKVLQGGGGRTPIQVPAQPWAGDGVVILRTVATTTVTLQSDNDQAGDDVTKLVTAPNTQLKVHVDQKQILATTSDRLVSFTFDFHLCEIEHPKSACNWHNASALNIDLPRLLPLAAALSPNKTALLRIGGGPADSVVYDVGEQPRPLLKRYFVGPMTHKGVGNYTTTCPTGPYCLTMERWDDLNAWALQAGVRIVFGLNSLSENMTEAYHGKSAVIAGKSWDPSNVKALLEYTKRKGYFEKGSIYGFELGNEIQGPAHDEAAGNIHRGLAAPFHARQFVTLEKIIREIWGEAERPRLIGPDMNAQKDENWTKSFVTTLNEANVTLDAFTIHAYDGSGHEHQVPGKLAHELPTPGYLDKLVLTGARYQGWLASLAPATELWIGEYADLAGSGLPGVSDSYEGVIQYMDSFGALARHGYKVLARQSLLGGDYELVDRDTFSPNPNYWLAWLWPRLMSTHALDVAMVASSDGVNVSRVVRAYAHCGLSPGGVTLALINLSPDRVLSIDVEGLHAVGSTPRKEYHLCGTASGAGGNTTENLASRTMYTHDGKSFSAESLQEPLLVTSEKPIVMAPLTVAFAEITDASAEACLKVNPGTLSV